MPDLTAETHAVELFCMGVIDWQQFVELDRIERAMLGRPPVPELTPEQEQRMWIRISLKLAEQREAEVQHD